MLLWHSVCGFSHRFREKNVKYVELGVAVAWSNCTSHVNIACNQLQKWDHSIQLKTHGSFSMSELWVSSMYFFQNLSLIVLKNSAALVILSTRQLPAPPKRINMQDGAVISGIFTMETRNDTSHNKCNTNLWHFLIENVLQIKIQMNKLIKQIQMNIRIFCGHDYYLYMSLLLYFFWNIISWWKNVL